MNSIYEDRKTCIFCVIFCEILGLILGCGIG